MSNARPHLFLLAVEGPAGVAAASRAPAALAPLQPDESNRTWVGGVASDPPAGPSLALKRAAGWAGQLVLAADENCQPNEEDHEAHHKVENISY